MSQTLICEDQNTTSLPESASEKLQNKAKRIIIDYSAVLEDFRRRYGFSPNTAKIAIALLRHPELTSKGVFLLQPRNLEFILHMESYWYVKKCLKEIQETGLLNIVRQEGINKNQSLFLVYLTKSSKRELKESSNLRKLSRLDFQNIGWQTSLFAKTVTFCEGATKKWSINESSVNTDTSIEKSSRSRVKIRVQQKNGQSVQTIETIGKYGLKKRYEITTSEVFEGATKKWSDDDYLTDVGIQRGIVSNKIFIPLSPPITPPLPRAPLIELRSNGAQHHWGSFGKTAARCRLEFTDSDIWALLPVKATGDEYLLQLWSQKIKAKRIRHRTKEARMRRNMIAHVSKVTGTSSKLPKRGRPRVCPLAVSAPESVPSLIIAAQSCSPVGCMEGEKPTTGTVGQSVQKSTLKTKIWEFFNSLPNMRSSKQGTKTYTRIERHLQALFSGSLGSEKYPLDPEWLKDRDIPKDLLKKVWTSREIMNVLSDISETVGQVSNGWRGTWRRTALDALIYDEYTQTSPFLSIALNGPALPKKAVRDWMEDSISDRAHNARIYMRDSLCRINQASYDALDEDAKDSLTVSAISTEKWLSELPLRRLPYFTQKCGRVDRFGKEFSAFVEQQTLGQGKKIHPNFFSHGKRPWKSFVRKIAEAAGGKEETLLKSYADELE